MVRVHTVNDDATHRSTITTKTARQRCQRCELRHPQLHVCAWGSGRGAALSAATGRRRSTRHVRRSARCRAEVRT